MKRESRRAKPPRSGRYKNKAAVGLAASRLTVVAEAPWSAPSRHDLLPGRLTVDLNQRPAGDKDPRTRKSA